MNADYSNPNISTFARIPYEKRSSWMADVHYNYGRKIHLHDIDYVISSEEGGNSIWMEHMGKQGVALAEFKNFNESIEIYKYGQLVWLADGRDIPAYIVVGTQDPYIYYYLIPLNEACKKLPDLSKPKYFSEKEYVKFLHLLRKIPADESVLSQFSDKLPEEKDRFRPNIK